VNFRQLRQGQQFVLVKSGGEQVESLIYHPEPSEEVQITRHADGFHAVKHEIPATTRTERVAGTIKSSLYDGVLAAGERPELAVRLAEIFAWDLDFYIDPRPGDTFRLVVEKKSYPGEEEMEYGAIYAAEYDNGEHRCQAVLFHDRKGRSGYFAADGSSLQKAFLRSPLKFAARISSHFSRHRFHPILRIYRPHLGTDYAAPVGTPVQAVARGRVEFAGRLGADGNMVRLRHANGYETYYMHLSRILVRPRQPIEQGQVVGLVGATGLATGPHLDFRVRQAGKFINFERMKLPPATPIARADLSKFESTRDEWLAEMAGNNTVSADAQSASDVNPGGTP
jgi:murein DD-endopeptidase MepM/ murein hydrolase activator NlpD